MTGGRVTPVTDGWEKYVEYSLQTLYSRERELMNKVIRIYYIATKSEWY
jgi:hypothetical protein